MEQNSKSFSLMVIGENPDEMIKKYDKSFKVEPYIKYYCKDAGILRGKTIKVMEDILESNKISDMMIDYLRDRIETFKKISDFEYYSMLTNGMDYDKDGNAIMDDNPDGKYSSCKIGKDMSIPLILNDGSITYQARNKDIYWDKMHMSNKDLYSVAWKLYKNEREPENDQEKKIYENLKHNKKYFEAYNSEEEYIKYNCSYWNYAYLDENGWQDIEESKNYDWVTGFYEKYVKPLKKDDLVTIYECVK